MRITAFALCGVASSAMMLPTEQVGALTHLAGMSGRHAEDACSLMVKIKKNKKCSLTFVCDYFNPATSCSKPPCCKKGHIEKECVPVSGAPGTTPAPPPEPAAGQCNLCTNKGDRTPWLREVCGGRTMPQNTEVAQTEVQARAATRIAIST
jgi:hypothetical protein